MALYEHICAYKGHNHITWFILNIHPRLPEDVPGVLKLAGSVLQRTASELWILTASSSCTNHSMSEGHDVICTGFVLFFTLVLCVSLNLHHRLRTNSSFHQHLQRKTQDTPTPSWRNPDAKTGISDFAVLVWVCMCVFQRNSQTV